MIRRQSGQFVPLMVVANSPESAPKCSVFNSSGSLESQAGSLAPVAPGVFGFNRRVTFQPGDYLLRYTWSESGVSKVHTELLRVLPGGEPSGSYRSITYYEPPHAGFVVGETRSNENRFKRNPRV